MSKPRDYQEALGQAIKNRRERVRLSREKFGRIVGKDADYVASVENGKAELDLHQMLVIATVLNTSLSVLLAVVEFSLADD